MKCCWYDVDDDHQACELCGVSWSHNSDTADDDDEDDDAHQACELCEEVAEVIGGMESEPRHAVAEDQPGAQH